MNKEMAVDLIELVNGLKELPKTKSVNYTTKKGGQLTFKYVPLDDLLAKIKENENFALLQPLGSKDGVQFIQNVLIHKSGESYASGEFELMINDQVMQEVGSVITYSRRYSLGAFLGIATETDNDAHPDEAPEEVKATSKQVSFLLQLMDAERIEKMLVHYKLNDIKEISKSQASELIEKLKK